jgi:tRNA(Ile)-lysidine synthase
MARRRRSIETALKQDIPTGSGVLVALSGGRDSMVLMDALLRARGLLKVRVEALHVDHGLRPSSVNDARFVEQHCRERGVPCLIERLGPKPSSANLEAWARQQRYRLLREALVARGLDWAVTAHNANDVAETLVIKLLANKELTTIERRDERRRCLRPLLDISREQIDEYAARLAVPYIDDPSNADVGLVRNRVRHSLMPVLKREFDPSAVWILAERARAIAADCNALEALAAIEEQSLGSLTEADPAWLARCAERLGCLPDALAWRVAQRLVLPLVGYEVGEKGSLEALKLLRGELDSLQLKQGIEVLRDRFGLRVLSSQLGQSSRL